MLPLYYLSRSLNWEVWRAAVPPKKNFFRPLRATLSPAVDEKEDLGGGFAAPDPTFSFLISMNTEQHILCLAARTTLEPIVERQLVDLLREPIDWDLLWAQGHLHEVL